VAAQSFLTANKTAKLAANGKAAGLRFPATLKRSSLKPQPCGRKMAPLSAFFADDAALRARKFQCRS
jgi:hypothetical protein